MTLEGQDRGGLADSSLQPRVDLEDNFSFATGPTGS
jgi:hypothetical protein